MKKFFVVLFVSLMLPVLASAAIISVNLAEADKDNDGVIHSRANQTILPGEVAGYNSYATVNWNNVLIFGGSGGSLIDNAGSATDAVIYFSAANAWGDSSANAGANGDQKLARGYFDDTETRGGIGVDIVVENVPYQLYDVVVYMGSDGASASWLPVMIGDFTQTGAPRDQYGNIGGWVEGQNVLIFKGLTDEHLGIQLPERWSDGDGSTRGTIAGFQIVEVPEPATMLLLGLGGLGLVRRRKA